MLDVAASHGRARFASLVALPTVGLILACLMVSCKGSGGRTYAALHEDEDSVALTPGTSGQMLDDLAAAILRVVNDRKKLDAKAKGKQVLARELVPEDRACTIVVKRCYRDNGKAMADFMVFADEREAKVAIGRLGPQTKQFGGDNRSATLNPVQELDAVALGDVKALSSRWLPPPWEMAARAATDSLSADQKLRKAAKEEEQEKARKELARKEEAKAQAKAAAAAEAKAIKEAAAAEAKAAAAAEDKAIKEAQAAAAERQKKPVR